MLAVGNTRSLDDPAPIPMSFPAILRNQGIASRYAYLSDSAPDKSQKPILSKKTKTLRRDDNEGKRWMRRKANARFSGNVHIVQPGRNDRLPPSGPQIPHTFPEPLPPYLARNNKVPTVTIPAPDPRSADCGRFSLSLKGMRRELRRMGFRSKLLVNDVETEIVNWLQTGGTLLSPDKPEISTLTSSGVHIGTTGTLLEISRTPLQLVWRITDDPFARYVVHCCARYHTIVSFSKEVSGDRLTYLLRPNVVYPESHLTAGLETPPATDMSDLSSHLDTDSEFGSDTRSEAGDSVAEAAIEPALSTIAEDSIPPSNRILEEQLDDDWAEVGDIDTDGDESGHESSVMEDSIDALPVPVSGDPDETIVAERLAQLSLRSRTWDCSQTRSTSSPSRSPVRPPRRTQIPAVSSTRNRRKTFYEYLFS